MEHLWSMLCKQVITSKETGNLTLIDIIETVHFSLSQKGKAAEIGAVPFPASVVSMWWRTKMEVGESAYMRVLIKDPDGKQLLPEENLEIFVDLEQGVNFRTAINLQNLPYTKNGMYKALVQAKTNTRWKEVAYLPYFLYEVDDLDEIRKKQQNR